VPAAGNEIAQNTRFEFVTKAVPGARSARGSWFRMAQLFRQPTAVELPCTPSRDLSHELKQPRTNGTPERHLGEAPKGHPFRSIVSEEDHGSGHVLAQYRVENWKNYHVRDPWKIQKRVFHFAGGNLLATPVDDVIQTAREE
jgi:hypothetical protein